MASQVVSSTVADLEVLEICSYVRSYHAYMDIWTPIQGQTLPNSKDNNTVGVFLDVIVGHVPHNLAPWFSQFL